MANIQEVDTLLQQVRHAAGQFRFSEDAAISQQILLFGDYFYGYRFLTTEFTAIWSASDQTLKLFDSNDQMLSVLPTLELIPGKSAELISSAPQRKVA